MTSTNTPLEACQNAGQFGGQNNRFPVLRTFFGFAFQIQLHPDMLQGAYSNDLEPPRHQRYFLQSALHVDGCQSSLPHKNCIIQEKMFANGNSFSD